MTTATYEVDGRIRVSVNVPEAALRFDPDVHVDHAIPVVICGDSTQSPAMHIGYQMLRDLGYSGRFIVDLLLVNGTCNRYLSVTVDRVTEKWDVKSAMNGDIAISKELHERCNMLQGKGLLKLAPTVLSEEHRNMLAWGIDIPQPKAVG